MLVSAVRKVDLRGLHLPFGTLAVAINSEPAEAVPQKCFVRESFADLLAKRVLLATCQTVFDDIALSSRCKVHVPSLVMLFQ